MAYRALTRTVGLLVAVCNKSKHLSFKVQLARSFSFVETKQSGLRAETISSDILKIENQTVWSHCRKALVHKGLQNGRNFAYEEIALYISSPSSTDVVSQEIPCAPILVTIL